MAYVVRDRRATLQWGMGLVASVVVVVVVCVATDRWWVAAVGVPLSVLWAAHRIHAETTVLRTDHAGIELSGRWIGWPDVEEVLVGAGRVEVLVADHAPLPRWAAGRVTGVGAGERRLRLSGQVRVERDAVLAGIRGAAPTEVRVNLV